MSFERTFDESALFRICFVCTGNICRSPMAETIFKQLEVLEPRRVELAGPMAGSVVATANATAAPARSSGRNQGTGPV